MRSFFGQFFYSLYTFQNFFNSASFSVEVAFLFYFFITVSINVSLVFHLSFYDLDEKSKKRSLPFLISVVVKVLNGNSKFVKTSVIPKGLLPNVFVIHFSFFNVWICSWQCQRGNRILCKIPFKTFLCQLSLKPHR